MSSGEVLILILIWVAVIALATFVVVMLHRRHKAKKSSPRYSRSTRGCRQTSNRASPIKIPLANAARTAKERGGSVRGRPLC